MKRISILPAHIAPKPSQNPRRKTSHSSQAAVPPPVSVALPYTGEPTIDGLTGMAWCKKHGFKFQFELPATRILGDDGEVLAIAYNASGPQGLINAIQSLKRKGHFPKKEQGS